MDFPVLAISSKFVTGKPDVMEFRTTAKIFFYGVSSSALLVLNKVCINAIPNASLLLFIQVLSTVLFIIVPALCGRIHINLRPQWKVLLAYCNVALVFLGTIYSNMQVVHAIGVNSFIVLRCGTPLLISFLDFLFLNRELPHGNSFISLFGIFISGSAYAYLKYREFGSEQDATEENSYGLRGLVWSFVWLSCFVVDMIYIKHVADSHKCTGLERTLYQNTLALPVLLVTLLTPIEMFDPMSTGDADNSALVALGLSCIAGTILSYTGMSLRTDLSATSFSILGIICKMASALLNEIFVSRESNRFSLLCIAGVIMSSSFFKQAPFRKAAHLPT